MIKIRQCTIIFKILHFGPKTFAPLFTSSFRIYQCTSKGTLSSIKEIIFTCFHIFRPVHLPIGPFSYQFLKFELVPRITQAIDVHMSTQTPIRHLTEFLDDWRLDCGGGGGRWKVQDDLGCLRGLGMRDVI